MLADSHGPIVDTLTAVLTERGHPIPPDLGQRVIGPPLPLALQELYGFEPDDPEVLAIVAEYRLRYGTTLLETNGFAGIPETLMRLVLSGLRLGVATSKPRPFAEAVLAALGLRDRFVIVAAPELDGVEGKTKTVERALDALGADVVALVGDRRFDIEAAQAHGLFAVGVTWGIGSYQELIEAGADAIVDRPQELVPVLVSRR